MSIYICPSCGQGLFREGGAYRCSARHSFDTAKSGYVNLLMSQRGTCHGDDALMVSARRDFLSRGHYSPLAQAVCSAVSRLCTHGAVIDAGCGEGYYTSAVRASLGEEAEIYGIDISKTAAEKAARLVPTANICVGSIYKMPYADSSAALVYNIFAPLAAAEYARVLVRGGSLVLAVPGAEHLVEMKRIVYRRVHIKESVSDELEFFTPTGAQSIKYTMELTGEDVRNLFKMTPYYYTTSRADARKIEDAGAMRVTADFRLLTYQKA